MASANNLDTGVQEVLDTLGTPDLGLRVTVDQELIYRLHHLAEERLAEGAPATLVITGLNLVQADPELGDYLEVEVDLG